MNKNDLYRKMVAVVRSVNNHHQFHSALRYVALVIKATGNPWQTQVYLDFALRSHDKLFFKEYPSEELLLSKLSIYGDSRVKYTFDVDKMVNALWLH